ncbi:MAG: hypothetical protein OXC57_09285, partial [Rhodobacteraceae bacterium]|nr:hypothetical protein [Paracoccaceae bacterium]
MVPALSAGPETRWPIPRADTAWPDAHSRCSDGWNPADLKGESRKRDFPRDSPRARNADGDGFHPAGRWTGHFQADPPSGIAWAFNPGQTTVSQPEKVQKRQWDFSLSPAICQEKSFSKGIMFSAGLPINRKCKGCSDTSGNTIALRGNVHGRFFHKMAGNPVKD